MLAALAYLTYIHLLGFPDGFVTELESAQRWLAWVFVVASMLFGAVSVYLGSFAPAQRIRTLAVALACYAVLAASAWGLNCYFIAHLMGGGGG